MRIPIAHKIFGSIGKGGSFSGTVQPHSYLLAKRVEEGVWIMANADGKGVYNDDRSTHLSLERSAEPVVEGEGTSNWSDGVLHLSLSHAQGASSVYVRF